MTVLREAVETALAEKKIENVYDQSFCKGLLKKHDWREREVRSLKRIMHGIGVHVQEHIVRRNEKVLIVNNRYYLEGLPDIESMPGREFHRRQQMWSIPINKYTTSLLKQKGFDVPEEESKSVVVQEPDDLELKPYPFQIEGWRKMEEFNGKALLADEPGLGKSLQSLLYLKNHPELRPALMIVPATLKLNWAKEMKKWGVDEEYKILQGMSDRLMDPNIVIMNYDLLDRYMIELSEVGFQLVIADEVHKICNITAQRTRAFKYIMQSVDHLIAISGTPITSRMRQFWVILSILLPDMFSNHQHFLDEYCWSEDGRYNGARNVRKLHEILKSTVMIRRLKKDVMKDLPPKQYQVVLLDINNRKEYETANSDFLNYLKDTEGYAKAKRASFAETLVKLGYLRRLAAEGKMNSAIEWIHDFLESGEKLVLFCEHRRVIDQIMDIFDKRIVKIDGRDSLKKRDLAVKEFQENDSIKLFIGNKAAQEGITLTKASNLAILEFPWTPGDIDQRSDRVHRISQEAKSVNIYYLTAHNTIEERMANIIDSKREDIQGIMDGTEPEQNEFIGYLINSYKNGGLI